MKHLITILLVLLTLAAVAVVWMPVIPLGVPGEWEWQRHKGFNSGLEFLDRVLPAVAGALPLLGFAVYGARRIEQTGQAGLILRYAVLMGVSWFWLHQVQQTAPPLHRTLKPWWVLYDKSSSGYFFEAAFEMKSVDSFLTTYEDRMREGEVLHVGTHPPGLFLVSRFCIAACQASPTLTSLLNGLEDTEVRTAFRTVEAETRLNRRLDDMELAALHLLSSLTTFAVILATIPLAVTVSQFGGRLAGWQAASLWATLPCLAVFLPKSDLLFPLTCTTALMFHVLAMNSRHSVLFGVLAGSTLWFGLMLSLAHLPVLVLIVILTGIRAISSRGASLWRDAIGLVFMLLSIVALSVVWSLSTRCNILTVWQLNLQNHEGFYSQFTRTWWKWLLVNPVELALALGPAVAVAAGSGFVRSIRRLFRKDELTETTDVRLEHLCVAILIALTLLWCSGKNQGEAARLWCFLTPWLLVASFVQSATDSPDRCRTVWITSLGCQLFYAAGVLSRVSGFSF